MAKVTLSVSGMTCDHCRGRVEGAAKRVGGVFAVYVDLADGIAEVDFDATRTSPEAIAEAITAAGYSAQATP